MSFLQWLSEYDSVVDIVSCVLSVLALVFTLYLWLVDHLSDDEARFIEGKDKFLQSLNESLEVIRTNTDPKVLLEHVERVNLQLELILNYRFWARSPKIDDYRKINEFYVDTKYLISTIRRFNEAQTIKAGEESLVSIQVLPEEELADIQTDYRKGLTYIIDFLENWR